MDEQEREIKNLLATFAEFERVPPWDTTDAYHRYGKTRSTLESHAADKLRHLCHLLDTERDSQIEALAATMDSQMDARFKAEAERDQAQGQVAAIAAVVEDVNAKLTSWSTGEWITCYGMPAGPWHKLLGLVRGVQATFATSIATIERLQAMERVVEALLEDRKLQHSLSGRELEKALDALATLQSKEGQDASTE